jgi:hypothetical protein
MAEATRFQPGGQFECLNRHGVRYVLIGGVAARLHGSIRKTGDVDICPAPDHDNAGRLVHALTELDARIYIDPDTPALPFSADAHSLRAMSIINTLTRFGRLDILWEPPGSDGFYDLHRDAVEVEVFGHPVTVASIEALIRTKGAAGRPKDLETIADLKFIRESGRGTDA